MEMILLKIDSGEWERLWDWVATHPINEGLDDPRIAENEGEMWMYMGSFRQDKRVIHELRHRLFPKTNSLQRLTMSATDLFNDNDIEKIIPIR